MNIDEEKNMENRQNWKSETDKFLNYVDIGNPEKMLEIECLENSNGFSSEISLIPINKRILWKWFRAGSLTCYWMAIIHRALNHCLASNTIQIHILQYIKLYVTQVQCSKFEWNATI